MSQHADTGLGFMVGIPGNMFGAYLLCWKGGRHAAMAGEGWRSGLKLSGRASRAYRLGWVSQRTGFTLTFASREGKKNRERKVAAWNRNSSVMAQGEAARAKIMSVLTRAAGPMRLKDIARALGRTDASIHSHICRLKLAGRVRQVGKLYVNTREEVEA